MALLFLPAFDLSAHNTLAVPARAAFYVSVSHDDELREALAFAREGGLPLLILGGGSNLLLADDFPGLVIHMCSRGKSVVAEDDTHIWLEVAAGEDWPGLVDYTLDHHYWGLENLSLIPGTVGAAPIQNIGAYGVELCDRFAELQAVEIASGLSVTFDRDACAFGYRDSVFKGRCKDAYVITSITLRLLKEPRLVVDYPALRQALAMTPEGELDPRRVADAVCQLRRSKLPDPAQLPNAGSFFKNPLVTRAHYDALRLDWPDLVAFDAGNGQMKLAAAWLIDRAGWRGYSAEGVGVHADQALVLINPGRCAGDRILALARRIQASVADHFGINLEPEPRIYGLVG